MLYVLFFAVLAVHTGCDHPLLGIFDRNRHDEQRDQRRLEQMRGEIDALAGEARCGSTQDCRYVGLGSKPCGGPWEYLIHSVADTDEAQLLEKVAAYNIFEQHLNTRYGRNSDCSLPPEPALGCTAGRCVDLSRYEGRGDVVVPPGPEEPGPVPQIGGLHFVEFPEEVPTGDPFALDRVEIEDDLLKIAVGYSGGCEPHVFGLWALKPYDESRPPRHLLFLRHWSNGDPCEAYIMRELRFELRSFRRLHPDQERIALVLEDGQEELEYVF